MLLYPAALPLSSRITAGVIRPSTGEDRVAVTQAEPLEQALLVLACLRKEETSAKSPTAPTPGCAEWGERANAQLKTWRILRKPRCCPWRAGHLAKPSTFFRPAKPRMKKGSPIWGLGGDE